jgi:Ca-activated chloride channel family protein
MRARTSITFCTGWTLLLILASCGRKDGASANPSAAPGSAGSAQTINQGPPVDGEATLTAPASAGAGAEIETGWTGPGNTGDYVDLVPRGYTNTSGEITYFYVRDGIPTGKLKVPTTPGEYDIRYVVQLANERKVRATSPLTVGAVSASITVPATAEAAEPFQIQWQGPATEGDYLDIVPAGYAQTSGEVTYAYTRDGNPSSLTAPAKAGAYEVRYVQEGTGGRKVLASSPLRVTQPTATLEAPAEVPRGARFKVEWNGPNRKGDYVDLVKRGQTLTSGEISYFYTAGGSPGELAAPAEAGSYELRYVLEGPGGRQVLVRRPVRVP